jgi:hypothetical protein
MGNNINPMLQDFAELIGDWEMVLSNTSVLPDPTAIINGTASFEWFEGGDFLILRQGTKKGETPWATWFIGHDKDSKNYTVLYLDDRQSSRVYEMSLENDTWKMWRNTPEFTQRFTGTISEDKKLIEGRWEKSTDGKTWAHDFDLTYRKNNNKKSA